MSLKPHHGSIDPHQSLRTERRHAKITVAGDARRFAREPAQRSPTKITGQPGARAPWAVSRTLINPPGNQPKPGRTWGEGWASQARRWVAPDLKAGRHHPQLERRPTSRLGRARRPNQGWAASDPRLGSPPQFKITLRGHQITVAGNAMCPAREPAQRSPPRSPGGRTRVNLGRIAHRDQQSCCAGREPLQPMTTGRVAMEPAVGRSRTRDGSTRPDVGAAPDLTLGVTAPDESGDRPKAGATPLKIIVVNDQITVGRNARRRAREPARDHPSRSPGGRGRVRLGRITHRDQRSRAMQAQHRGQAVDPKITVSVDGERCARESAHRSADAATDRQSCWPTRSSAFC